MTVKGMLMQKNGRKGVVMTSDGDFVQVRLNSHSGQIGEEVEGNLYASRPYMNRKFFTTMIATAVMLLVILIPGYNIFTPQAMAYVAVDINPSIEMAVDKKMSVIEVHGLNDDGKKFLSEVDLASMQLYQALPTLMEKAINDGYIKTDQENVVLSTFTINDKYKEDIGGLNENKIQQALNKPIQSKKILARVVVSQTDEEVRKKAKETGLSMGKYLIYQQAKKQGINMSVKDLTDNSIKHLEQSKKIKLERLLQKKVTPGHQKQLEKQLKVNTKKTDKLQQHISPEDKKRKQLPRDKDEDMEMNPHGLKKKKQKLTDEDIDTSKISPGQVKKSDSQASTENKKNDKMTPIMKENNSKKQQSKIDNKMDQHKHQQQPDKTSPGQKEHLPKKSFKDKQMKGNSKNKK